MEVVNIKQNVKTKEDMLEFLSEIMEKVEDDEIVGLACIWKSPRSIGYTVCNLDPVTLNGLSNILGHIGLRSFLGGSQT